MGVVHYLQTQGYRGRRFPNHRLAWVAPHIGIREGRRVEALYQLTADDILIGRHFPDGVAVGSYHTDYHWPTVVQRAGTGVTVQCPPHQIPLRAMRPRGATNLLVPGRCLGGDHLATSSFRVMGTCAQTGFAAGVAAAMGSPARSIDAVDVPELRARLRRAGVRLDLAPYYSYLRRRRGYDQPTGAAAAPVSALAVAELATGEVLIAYTADAALGVLRRYEERWHPAVAPDAASSAHSGAELAFTVADGGRNRTEEFEQVPAMAAEVTESDDPPEVTLHADERAWVSADGGVSWRTLDAAATGGNGAFHNGDAPPEPARPEPPVPGAAVVSLTLTGHDRASLDVTRLYAAAWTTGDGVVLGTAGGSGRWRQTVVAVPGGHGPCALTATADGVLLACVDGNAIRCLRLSLDAIVATGEHGKAADAAWHHDSADLIDALKERQPATVP